MTVMMLLWAWVAASFVATPLVLVLFAVNPSEGAD